MAVIFNIVLPILAGLAILAMFFFIWRAFNARSEASYQAYNVGRQEALKSSRVNLIRAAFALIIALIFVLTIVIIPNLRSAPAQPIETPFVETPQPTSEVTVEPTELPATNTLEPSPTVPLPTATNVPLPTETNTPAPQTATVSSGVGVWLRAAPGVETEQLEWLLDGTIVIVLNGVQTVDDLVWQQVQTENGVTGWVASEFIVLNEQQ